MSNTHASRESGSLHDELRRLRQQAGKPSLINVQEHAELEGHEVSKSAFGNLLNGRGKPRWHTVEAFVAGCEHYAATRRPPLQLPPELVDLSGWRARYDADYPDTAARPVGSSTTAALATARRDYEARWRALRWWMSRPGVPPCRDSRRRSVPANR
ncbi:MAG: hypothetical protein LC799_31240 [Actinobacteria bacterium]|nr:hypothetical protein [Actinomycetota bacterium]